MGHHFLLVPPDILKMVSDFLQTPSFSHTCQHTYHALKDCHLCNQLSKRAWRTTEAHLAAMDVHTLRTFNFGGGSKRPRLGSEELQDLFEQLQPAAPNLISVEVQCDVLLIPKRAYMRLLPGEGENVEDFVEFQQPPLLGATNLETFELMLYPLDELSVDRSLMQAGSVENLFKVNQLPNLRKFTLHLNDCNILLPSSTLMKAITTETCIHLRSLSLSLKGSCKSSTTENTGAYTAVMHHLTRLTNLTELSLDFSPSPTSQNMLLSCDMRSDDTKALEVLKRMRQLKLLQLGFDCIEVSVGAFCILKDLHQQIQKIRLSVVVLRQYDNLKQFGEQCSGEGENVVEFQPTNIHSKLHR
eukprot:TRINITY_DN20672_c0_g1_i1.p1 TRINITY_DN20672_c0_g1~~TRINITY_DN20672_c0_g1_i1.p1  ORF type:complete len:357 (+),score=10.37 TRINITY_DN20672_c0_g1_i1:43-1113(+)